MTVIKDTGQRATLPPFGEEHEELRETVRKFVSKEIAPNVEEWEEAREFPRELYERCAKVGFLGLKFPEGYGGQGGTHLHDAIWVEELARSGGWGGAPARRSARWGSPSPGRGPTSPGSRPSPSASTAATSSTARRPSSPTACAPTS